MAIIVPAGDILDDEVRCDLSQPGITVWLAK